MAEQGRGSGPLLRAASSRGRINLGVQRLLASLSRRTPNWLGCRTSLTRTGDRCGLLCATTLVLPATHRSSPRVLLLLRRCRAVSGSGISHRAVEATSAGTRLPGSACGGGLRTRCGARGQPWQPRPNGFAVLSCLQVATPFEIDGPLADEKVRHSSEIRRADCRGAAIGDSCYTTVSAGCCPAIAVQKPSAKAPREPRRPLFSHEPGTVSPKSQSP